MGGASTLGDVQLGLLVKYMRMLPSGEVSGVRSLHFYKPRGSLRNGIEWY